MSLHQQQEAQGGASSDEEELGPRLEALPFEREKERPAGLPGRGGAQRARQGASDTSREGSRSRSSSNGEQTRRLDSHAWRIENIGRCVSECVSCHDAR